MQRFLNPLKQLVHKPKWYHLYYVLAVFDLGTITLTLILSHHILGIYSDTVTINSQWSQRLGRYSELGELASVVNQPGNDLFSSGDIELEKKRLKLAVKNFEVAAKNARVDLNHNISSQQAELLLFHLTKIESTIDQVATEARAIFSDFENNKMSSAGAHMALMDQHFFKSLTAVGRLSSGVRDIQADQFQRESERAAALSRYEFAISGVVFLIICCVTCYGHNLSKQMLKKDNQLEEAEGHTSAILTTAFDAIVCIDQRGIIKTFNPAAEKLFGYTVEEVVGENISVVVPAPHRHQHDQYLSRYLKTGWSNIVGAKREAFGERKDGTKVPIALSVTEYTIGEDTFFAGIVHDITEQRKREELQRSKDVAEQSNKAKSEFLANMSHELRTPMNSIIGFTKRVLTKMDGQLDDRNLDALQTVERNAHHLLGLINGILDISKIEAGKMDFSPTDFNLVPVMNDVIQQAQTLTDHKPIQLILDLPDEKLDIQADQVKVAQIATNLVTNGIKYSDEGTVTLKVSRQQHAELGPAVAISVSDTGHGIHEADLELLFKKFTQFDADAARPGGGTGLGLYITSMFVKMHNGLIDVESKFGHGTKFTVFLPIQATANYERPQHELENLTSVETAPEEALSASTS